MHNQVGVNGVPGDLNKAKPHFVLVPFVAQGHMIPMLDLARLLASAGATVTFISTPVNSGRIRPVIDSIERSGLPIHFVDLKFPAAEAGLPAGCENVDLIPTLDLKKPFAEALRLLAPQLELHLIANSAVLPDCIIFDNMNSWPAMVAKSLGIPRLIFYSSSCFYQLCMLLVKNSRVLESVTDDSELVAIPGLPEPVELMKAHVSSFLDAPGWEKISEEIRAAEESAQGAVINTFEELEHSWLEKYRKETGKKVWPVGPLSLCNKDEDGQAMRGQVPSIDTKLLVSWLDSKAPSSVMFISFGSLSRNPLSQQIEIGRGLELALSSLPSLSFIWVVKETEESGEGEKWPTEFERRTEGRGMMIRGWAPQALILTHAAVGGFMTHCGWNSTLEAVAAGVVMATWPRFGDQFANEKFIVELLKVGVPVAAKAPTPSEKALVKGDEVGRAVERVMDGGEEGDGRRRRAGEFGEKARRAMDEGGSSFENLKAMIGFAKGENTNED